MYKTIFSKIFALIVPIFFLSFYAYAAEPVSVSIVKNSDSVALGSDIEVKLNVSSPDPVNAFEITLVYSPEIFELSRVSTAGSIVAVWKSLPSKNSNGGIDLIGGMTAPFSGENGNIITLYFHAKQLGASEFALKKDDFYLADGKGTAVKGNLGSSQIAVNENGPASTLPKETAPKISNVLVTKDPSTRSQIILVQASDQGAVQDMYMRTRSWFSWSDWQQISGTASVLDSIWAIELRAIGWDNQESSVIIYRWNIVALKVLILLAFLWILWFFKRRLVS